MRSYTRVGDTSYNQSFRFKVSSLIFALVPNWAIIKIMETRFTNFGVETTNICNANCSFCAYRYMERPKATIPNEIYEKAVTSYSEAGGGNVNFTPTVGDPFVDKRLLKKIRFARKQKNIDEIFLYTNAILLHRFGYEKVLESGLSRLAISTFVGSREGYKKYYGKDKYDATINNILQMVRLNHELGSPVRITLHLRVSMDQSEWRDTDTYKTLADYLGEENIDFMNVYDAWSGKIKASDLPYGCSIDQPIPLEEKSKEPCFELYRRVHVLSNGNVGACVCADLEAEINLGSLHEQSLDEIWHGQRLKDYRKNWKKGDMPEICKSCTRYMPLSDFVNEKKRNILTQYLKRTLPFLFP